MGGTSKPHAMYMRYWSLLKKPPTPSKGLPDLEELIQAAKLDGSIGSKGFASSGGGGKKRVRKGGKAAKTEDSEDEAAVIVNKKAKKADLGELDGNDDEDV
jgi:hypothetical protein